MFKKRYLLSFLFVTAIWFDGVRAESSDEDDEEEEDEETTKPRHFLADRIDYLRGIMNSIYKDVNGFIDKSINFILSLPQKILRFLITIPKGLLNFAGKVLPSFLGSMAKKTHDKIETCDKKEMHLGMSKTIVGIKDCLIKPVTSVVQDLSEVLTKMEEVVRAFDFSEGKGTFSVLSSAFFQTLKSILPLLQSIVGVFSHLVGSVVGIPGCISVKVLWKLGRNVLSYLSGYLKCVF